MRKPVGKQTLRRWAAYREGWAHGSAWGAVLGIERCIRICRDNPPLQAGELLILLREARKRADAASRRERG